MTQRIKQARMPQVLISNLMRRKFNHRDTNTVTAPASDPSLVGAVLYSGEVMK